MGRLGGDAEPGGQRGQLLHQPHRQHGGRHVKARLKDSGDAEGAGSVEEPAGQGGHRQRQAHLSALQGDFLRRRMGTLSRRKMAQTQRVLWASTSTKDPSYPDVLYVDELIGPDTVNTIPPATFDAFRDHGTTEGQPGGGYRCRPGHHGDARAGRHLHEEGHRRTGDAGREAVRRALRQAAQHRGRQMQIRVRQAEVDPQTYSLPAEIRDAVRGSHRGLEDGGQSAPPVGARCVAVDRLGRRQLAGMAGHHGRSAGLTGSILESLPPTSRAAASSTRCCSAWAAPASVRKF